MAESVRRRREGGAGGWDVEAGDGGPSLPSAPSSPTPTSVPSSSPSSFPTSSSSSSPSSSSASSSSSLFVSCSPRRPRCRIVTLAVTAVVGLLFYSKIRHTEVLVPGGENTVVSFAEMTPRDVNQGCALNGWQPLETPRRVFDMFPLFNELDMLEVRLNELKDVVDVFVIQEASITHSGKPKPLIFEKHKNEPRFAPFLNRIVHHVFNDTEGVHLTDAHQREQRQRSAMIDGLDMAGAKPDDIVLFSDLDEIIRPDVLGLLKSCTGYGWPVTVHMVEYIYDFGCRVSSQTSWTRCKVVQRKQLTRACGWGTSTACPHDLRDNQALRLGLLQTYPPPLVVHEGGWHFTWFLNQSQMLTKLAAYSHPERNTAKNRDPNTLRCLVNKCMHINRVDFGTRVAADDQPQPLPRYVLQHRSNPKWNKFFQQPVRDPDASTDC